MMLAPPFDLRLALLLAAPLACGDSTTASAGSAGEATTDVTGGTTASTTTTGQPTTSSTSTGESTTAGDTTCVMSEDPGDETTDGMTDETSAGDDAPVNCHDEDFPVSAPLCGGANLPCVVKRDETISVSRGLRNDAPSLALRDDCRPLVLYSEATGHFAGFYTERTGPDTWTIEPTPIAAATGSLEASSSLSTAYAVFDDGKFGVTLWRRRQGQWNQRCALGGKNHARSLQLARGPNELLHLGHIDGDDNLLLETFDETWSTKKLDGEAMVDVRLALATSGAPNLVYWTGIGPSALRWSAPPASPEVVAPLVASLARRHSALALAPGDVPWVLFARSLGGQDDRHEIVLAHRAGSNDWPLEVLAEETPEAYTFCDEIPEESGLQCAFDYTTLYPLAVFASGADVRALYLSTRAQGAVISECNPVNMPDCQWVPQSIESSSELRIAWPGSMPAEHLIISKDVFTTRATYRLDPGGNMHIAFYEALPLADGSAVRYLMIGL